MHSKSVERSDTLTDVVCTDYRDNCGNSVPNQLQLSKQHFTETCTASFLAV